ncbi:MAG: DUF427 domain-containing protein [Myxococcota bacterium]
MKSGRPDPHPVAEARSVPVARSASRRNPRRYGLPCAPSPIRLPPARKPSGTTSSPAILPTDCLLESRPRRPRRRHPLRPARPRDQPPAHLLPPLADVVPGVLRPLDDATLCEWKGTAAYYDVLTDALHRPPRRLVLPERTGPPARPRRLLRRPPRLHRRRRARPLPARRLLRRLITSHVAGPFKGGLRHPRLVAAAPRRGAHADLGRHRPPHRRQHPGGRGLHLVPRARPPRREEGLRPPARRRRPVRPVRPRREAGPARPRRPRSTWSPATRPPPSSSTSRLSTCARSRSSSPAPGRSRRRSACASRPRVRAHRAPAPRPPSADPAAGRRRPRAALCKKKAEDAE